MWLSPEDEIEGRTVEVDKNTPRRVEVRDDLDPRVTTVTRVEKVIGTILDAVDEGLGGGEAILAPPPALDHALDPDLPPIRGLRQITDPRVRITDVADAVLAKTLVSLPLSLGVESCLASGNDDAHHCAHRQI